VLSISMSHDAGIWWGLQGQVSSQECPATADTVAVACAEGQTDRLKSTNSSVTLARRVKGRSGVSTCVAGGLGVALCRSLAWSSRHRISVLACHSCTAVDNPGLLQAVF
jgi:hypothetical protein